MSLPQEPAVDTASVRVLLRITDETSKSPLLGDDTMFATYPAFELAIAPSHWRREYQGSFADWREIPDDTLDEMVEHITGGWSGKSFSREPSSPWISTSANFEWTVWEISRRLTLLGRDYIHLSVIQAKFSKFYRGLKPVKVDAWNVLRLRARQGYDHPDLKLALRFAGVSREYLFFGKIFGHHVQSVTTWTEDAPGLPLPEEYFKPKKARHGGWMDWLVWDPVEDTSIVAMAKIAERRDQLRTSRVH